VTAAVVAVVAGDGRGAAFLVAGAVAAFVVRFALFPAPYDLALVLALVVQCGGEALRLYDAIAWFDSLGHVTRPR
jgi:hypothetical protein